MQNVSSKLCTENQETHSVFNFFVTLFLCNKVQRYGRVSEAKGKNIIRDMRFACCIKSLQTNTQNIEHLMLFDNNNRYVNASQYSVIRTLCLLL